MDQGGRDKEEVVVLDAPKWYWDIPLCQRKKGRCGPGKGLLEKLVPETCWGLWIGDCCQIHDKDYDPDWNIEIQKALTLPEPERSATLNKIKSSGDRRLRNNILRKVRAADKKLLWIFKWLTRLRRRCASTYYHFVDEYGGPAFWDRINELIALTEK